MKIWLINICYIESFLNNKYYNNSINFLETYHIKYQDFTENSTTIEDLIQNFNNAINSDCDILWCIRWWSECINILNYIDRSNIWDKKIIWISDFTHFSMFWVSKWITSYYWECITKLNTKNDVQLENFLYFLQTWNIKESTIEPLYNTWKSINLSDKNIIGWHIVIFNFMQSFLNISLTKRYLFIEYHSQDNNLGMFWYYLDQLKYLINENMPIWIIIWTIDIKIGISDLSNSEINQYIINRFRTIEIPIYSINHINHIIKFS